MGREAERRWLDHVEIIEEQMARCDCAISPSDYGGPCKPDNTSQKLPLKGEKE